MNYEQAYDELLHKYGKLAAEHAALHLRHDELKSNFFVVKSHRAIKDSGNKKLKLEIRSLHRKLRDANRGAERNAHSYHILAKEFFDYKLKHPEKTEVEIFKGTMKCGVDIAQGLDQTVTYIYDVKVHTAKIQQQQNDGA